MSDNCSQPNFDTILNDINSSVNKVLTDSLLPIIKSARHNHDQYSIITNLLKQLPEFQNLLHENAELKFKLSQLTQTNDCSITLEIEEKNDCSSKDTMFNNIQNIMSAIENNDTDDNTNSSQLSDNSDPVSDYNSLNISDTEEDNQAFENNSPTFPSKQRTTPINDLVMLDNNDDNDDDDDDDDDNDDDDDDDDDDVDETRR